MQLCNKNSGAVCVPCDCGSPEYPVPHCSECAKHISESTNGMVNFNFKKVGKGTKYGDVLLRNIKLEPSGTEFLLKIKAAMQDAWWTTTSHLNINNLGETAMPQDVDVTIVGKSRSDFWVPDYSMKVPCVIGDLDLITDVNDFVTLDDAVACTWPDANGKMKIACHVQSRLARRKFNMGVSDPSWKYIDIDKINNNDWQYLEDYIHYRRREGVQPSQRIICDIVKKISRNIQRDLEKAEAELLKLDGTTYLPEDMSF